MFTTSRTFAVLAAASLAAVLAPQTVLAQGSGVINACVGKALGTMRFTDASLGCRSGERLLSWSVQGPQGVPGAQGPQGPAGPQFSLAASIRGDGSIEALTAPPGASLTVTRASAGVYNIVVTGLGTGCPLPTATAFHSPTVMWLSAGACGGGSLEIPVRSGNAVDTPFVLSVSSQGSPVATAAGARASRAVPATTVLGR